MNISVVVATCGDESWAELAWKRAWPSAKQRYADDKAPRIAVAHYGDLSLAQARNSIVHDWVAAGPRDWLCFLDADDELEPGYLAAAACALDHRPPGVPPLLVPAVRYVGRPTRTPPAPQFPNRGRWPELNECVIGTLVRRDLFERVGGFRSHSDDGTELTLYEDWDLFLRCHDAGSSLVYVEDAVYRAYVNPRGLGRNQGPNARTVYDAIWADHEARIAGMRANTPSVS